MHATEHALAHDRADVVGDDEDGDTVLPELAEQHVDFFPTLNVHSGDGLRPSRAGLACG